MTHSLFLSVISSAPVDAITLILKVIASSPACIHPANKMKITAAFIHPAACQHLSILTDSCNRDTKSIDGF